jgi:hypothetical protein
MKEFKALGAAIAMTFWSPVVVVINSAAAADDPVLNAGETSTWTWQWGARRGYTGVQCPGGDGVITVTPGGRAAFKGRAKDSGGKYIDIPAKGGSWSYTGIESSTQKRTYALQWGNDTDGVALSQDGRKLEGANGSGSGPCYVTGTRR